MVHAKWHQSGRAREANYKATSKYHFGIPSKVLMYIIIAVSTLILGTILSEMNFPIVPNIFRWSGTKINTVYKLLVPLILVSFGVYLQLGFEIDANTLSRSNRVIQRSYS